MEFQNRLRSQVTNLHYPEIEECEGLSPLAYRSSAPTVSQLIGDVCLGYQSIQGILLKKYESYGADPQELLAKGLENLRYLHTYSAGVNATCTVGQQMLIQQAMRAISLHPSLLLDPDRSNKFADSIIEYGKSISNLDSHNFGGVSESHFSMMELQFFEFKDKLKIREMLEGVKLGINGGISAFMLAESHRFVDAMKGTPYSQIGYSVKSLEAMLHSATRINNEEELSPYNQQDYRQACRKFLLKKIGSSIKINGWDDWRESAEAVGIVARLLVSDSGRELTFDLPENIAKSEGRFPFIAYYSSVNRIVRTIPILRGEPCQKIFNCTSLLSCDGQVLTWDDVSYWPDKLTGCYAIQRPQYADFQDRMVEFLKAEDTLPESFFAGQKYRKANALVYNDRIYDSLLIDNKVATATATFAVFSYPNYYGAVVALSNGMQIPFINGRFITEVPEGKIQKFVPYDSDEEKIIGRGTLSGHDNQIIEVPDLEIFPKSYF